MKINLIWIGKPKYPFTKVAVDLYIDRLKHYTKVEVKELKDVKTNKPSLQKSQEAKTFLKQMASKYNICLDENGKEMTSIVLSKKIESYQIRSLKEMNIIIGGAFGFHHEILEQCDEKWALSKMTLPHDICRILITEQLYRAYSIIKGENYHNP